MARVEFAKFGAICVVLLAAGCAGDAPPLIVPDYEEARIKFLSSAPVTAEIATDAGAENAIGKANVEFSANHRGGDAVAVERITLVIHDAPLSLITGDAGDRRGAIGVTARIPEGGVRAYPQPVDKEPICDLQYEESWVPVPGEDKSYSIEVHRERRGRNVARYGAISDFNRSNEINSCLTTVQSEADYAGCWVFEGRTEYKDRRPDDKGELAETLVPYCVYRDNPNRHAFADETFEIEVPGEVWMSSLIDDLPPDYFGSSPDGAGDGADAPRLEATVRLRYEFGEPSADARARAVAAYRDGYAALRGEQDRRQASPGATTLADDADAVQRIEARVSAEIVIPAAPAVLSIAPDAPRNAPGVANYRRAALRVEEQPLEAKVAYAGGESPIDVVKKLCVQPVFITDPATGATTGKSFWLGRNAMIEQWRKAAIDLELRTPIIVRAPFYRLDQSLNTSEMGTALWNFSYGDPGGEAFQSACVEIVVVDQLARETNGEPEYGGGATIFEDVADVMIVTSDENARDYDPNVGGVYGNANHLAHELGHALGISHPRSPRPRPGTPGTLMCPSGINSDNPPLQSRANVKLARRAELELLDSDFGYAIETDCGPGDADCTRCPGQ